MRHFIVALLLLCVCFANAQKSDFPRNYAGVFMASGYYTEMFRTPFGAQYNGVDITTIGLRYAFRMTQNIYMYAGGMPAGDAGSYGEIGMKANFFVHHKLQPSVMISVGTKLGSVDASNIYGSFGLDWHALPFFVVNSDVLSDYTSNAQFFRLGGSFKF